MCQLAFGGVRVQEKERGENAFKWPTDHIDNIEGLYLHKYTDGKYSNASMHTRWWKLKYCLSHKQYVQLFAVFEICFVITKDNTQTVQS